MAYFYSEKMTYCQAVMPTEIAWDVMNKLGKLEIVSLEHSIINYENPFVKSYRRCDEVLTKISIMKAFIQGLNTEKQYKIVESSDFSKVLDLFQKDILASKMHGYLYMNTIEDEIQETHHYLENQKHELDNLEKEIKELVIELALLLTISSQNKFKSYFSDQKIQFLDEDLDRKWGMNKERGKEDIFENKCICLNRKDLLMFKRSLFRITRGNSWVDEVELRTDILLQSMSNSNQLKKQIQNILKDRVICMIIYQKGQKNTLMHKINRFLSCLECHILKSNLNKLGSETTKIKQKLKEIESIEELTVEGIGQQVDKLCEIRSNSDMSWISYMQVYTKKQRQIYRVLSTTKLSTNLMQFNLYIPSKELPLHIQPNENLPPLILNVKTSLKEPPSKFDINCMLEIPQEIVNTYGVPSYGEINPAVFYIMSFGFFIGVMFGDVGHMLMTIPLLLYFKANIWFWTVTFFMGYSGFLYNQFFGQNISLFTSCYNITSAKTASLIHDCTYPFGIDSIWKISENQMQFTNSLKMKMAVIIGVVHMLFGLLIKLINSVKHNKKADIFLLVIPQIMFLSCTFVYMDYLIILKWLQFYADTKLAPSIITSMIQIFVGMAKEKEGDLLFWSTERSYEKVILIIALFCIPIMLIGKPLVIYCQKKQLKSSIMDAHQLAEEHQNPNYFDIQDEKIVNDEKMDYEMSENEKESKKTSEMMLGIFSGAPIQKQENHEDEMQEIIVHQIIETIEFVLGCVSNTASYLRLWALSLAHAQLSEVIFEMILLKAIKGGYSSLLGLFIAFPFFFVVTFGILICMDSMECFLHSLRLHWVEFQNKFYSGKGYLFEPISFSKIIRK